MNRPVVTLLWNVACAGPDGCGGHDGVVWQGDCTCAVFACRECGSLGWSSCGDIDVPEHEDAFNAVAGDL